MDDGARDQCAGAPTMSPGIELYTHIFANHLGWVYV